MRIRTLGREGPRAEVWAKMEQANPGGSVKDRICLAMIEEAERTGQLRPGGVVVEPTSGNTGIGLALVCAVRGYRCILAMPESMSLERRQLLEAFGAEVVLTPEEQQMEGAIAQGARRSPRRRRAPSCPQQFDNPANPPHPRRDDGAGDPRGDARASSIDAFVAGVGTGGTISGVGEVLEAGARAHRRGRRGRAGERARRSRAGSAGRRRSRGSRRGSSRRTTTRRRRRGADGDRRRCLGDQGRRSRGARGCSSASARARRCTWRSKWRASSARARTS